MTNKSLLTHLLLAFLLCCGSPTVVRAQFGDRISKTWGTPNSGAISGGLADRMFGKPGAKSGPMAGDFRDEAVEVMKGKPRPPARSGTHRTSRAAPANVARFVAVADSGVARQLAAALSSKPDEQAALLQVFQKVKQSYETEVRKAGKANNLAAALTFFIATGLTVYHDTNEPPELATNNLMQGLEIMINESPDFARMSNLDKQQLHDWLVCMGGFVLATYVDAKQSNSAESLATARELADVCIKLVLQTEAARLRFTATGLEIVS